jgi:RNA-dependent RNA polymerase
MLFVAEPLYFAWQQIQTLQFLCSSLDGQLKLQGFILTQLDQGLRNLADVLLFDSNAKRELGNYFNFNSSHLVPDLDVADDPLLRAMLWNIYKKRLADIISKGKIPIPHCQGRLLLGVTDETKTLKEGEVFIKMTEKATKNCFDVLQNKSCLHNPSHVPTGLTIKGHVLVSKNPCMFPSDIQKATAVAVNENQSLNESIRNYFDRLVDCIVFSQQGDRPLPDKIAGSDLDGDQYWVVWNYEGSLEGDTVNAGEAPKHWINKFKKLISSIRTEEAKECGPSNKKKSPFGICEMIENFKQFIMHEFIEDLKELHLCVADRWGLTSDKCIEIAQHFTIAVDSLKTEENVTAYKETYQSADGHKYPQFLQKNAKDSYDSVKVIGNVYSRCNCIAEAVDELIPLDVKANNTCSFKLDDSRLNTTIYQA